MLNEQKLYSLFDGTVAQIVAAAKANTTSYGEAMHWISVHVDVQRRVTDAELQSTHAMLLRRYREAACGDARQQLEKEALGLPITKH